MDLQVVQRTSRGPGEPGGPPADDMAGPGGPGPGPDGQPDVPGPGVANGPGDGPGPDQVDLMDQ